MISYIQALEIIKKQSLPVATEQLPLNQLSDRILMETISSNRDDPPFDRALMDGFACRRSDLSKSLYIINKLHAGEQFSGVIQPGEALQIMTGAPVPEGGEIIFKIEDALISGDRVSCSDQKIYQYIAPRGSYLKAGTELLKPGVLLTPRRIGICAFCGYNRVTVARKPVVAIIATGDELVTPGEPVTAASIYNSSSYQLYQQVIDAGGEPLDLGIVSDDPDAIRERFDEAFQKADLVISTGGVSMGEHDYVRDLFEQRASEIYFNHIALKPGKRTFFGKIEGRYCFGLPGNPVSTLIVFELLVKPLIHKMAGYFPEKNALLLPLIEDATDRDSGRTAFIPVIHDQNGVKPLRYHGSGNLTAYRDATGIIEIPVGETTIKKGTPVAVRPI